MLAALASALTAVVAIVCSVLLLRQRPNVEQTKATAEPPRVTQPAASIPDSRPASNATTESESAEAVDNVGTRAKNKTKTLGTAAAKATSQDIDPAPRTDASGSFRPHKIAPFRPKGI
jgi:hypothetical protein